MLRAGAYVVLGNAWLAESHLQQASRRFENAADLFCLEDNLPNWGNSAGLLSAARTGLGDFVKATVAAEKAVELSVTVGGALRQSKALNHAGVLALWSGNARQAESYLEAAVWFAEDTKGGASAAMHSLLILGVSEATSVARAEWRDEQPDLSKLVMVVSRARRTAYNSQLAAFKANADMGKVIYAFLNCFLASRTGKRDDAHVFFRRCLQSASKLSPRSWLHGFVSWARLELARANGDSRHAVVMSQAMEMAAKRGEHLPMQVFAQDMQQFFRDELG